MRSAGPVETLRGQGSHSAFSHEALLYRGEDEFVEAMSAFICDGLRASEAVLVVVSARKIGWLRARLGAAAAAVRFADMAEVGRNPARIIPAWRDFVDEQVEAGRGFRGIGEPIGPDRSADEMVECQHHESLLNLAFAGSGSWRLLWLVNQLCDLVQLRTTATGTVVRLRMSSG